MDSVLRQHESSDKVAITDGSAGLREDFHTGGVGLWAALSVHQDGFCGIEGELCQQCLHAFVALSSQASFRCEQLVGAIGSEGEGTQFRPCVFFRHSEASSNGGRMDALRHKVPCILQHFCADQNGRSGPVSCNFILNRRSVDDHLRHGVFHFR